MKKTGAHMDFWGFEAKPDLPGSQFALQLAGPAAGPQLPASKPVVTSSPAGAVGGGGFPIDGALMGAGMLAGLFMTTEASKNNADAARDATIGAANAQKDARISEARILGDTKSEEARLITNAGIAQARAAADARIAEANAQADTANHLSDNELRALENRNQGTQLQMTARSHDLLMETAALGNALQAQSESTAQIIGTNAALRAKEIKSDETKAEGEQKVALREIDARIAEARRPESVETDPFRLK